MSNVVDYRQTLKSAFSERREKNPSYSLRSFARDLSVSTSMLSEVLNYKKNLTRKTAAKINTALKLSKNESKLFLLAVDLDSPSVAQSRETVQATINEHSAYGKTILLQDDQFAYVSDFRHIVLLSLLGLKSFKNNLSWIASKLGVFQHEVNTLMNRLKKLKIIETDNIKKIKINYKYVYSPDGTSSQGIRAFHKATLAHTIQTIETVPSTERDLYTSIFAIDQNDFSEIQNEVREFHKKIYNKYAQKPTADRVYAVQNQLVPYTTRGVSHEVR